MTPGTQAPFLLLLLLLVLTGEGHKVGWAAPSGGGVNPTTATRASAPSSTAQSGVPGWGIALLVLVCVLVLLAIVYYIALAVCQCRQKSYGHLDIFPTRDTYHPMSEYPTYHTHGRYVPPGSTRRNPYEEVSTGNGGGSLSYTNPAVAATSANL
uniref:Mucin 1, cell surface associated n=1 Tax=Chinchilla lanigera TaxID=34839 RepID=A0A8C2UZ76_CHILA